jgi:hypothetical protein
MKRHQMKKIGYLVGLLLALGACTRTQGYPTESDCYSAPPNTGETGNCAYYPGYGWGHVPVYHLIIQG